MNLPEIGLRIRARREELGLSQDRLAKLCALSRVTINQLETGTIGDLGVAKLLNLLNLLGLTLATSDTEGVSNGLQMASRTASVSYKTVLTLEELVKAMVLGQLEPGRAPHLATLLDEAPLAIIVKAVQEAALLQHVPPKRIWRNLVHWARELQSPRPAWA